MAEIKITKINGSSFDLTYFKVISNTANPGWIENEFENVLINALNELNSRMI
jgi:hypothetical protein